MEIKAKKPSRRNRKIPAPTPAEDKTPPVEETGGAEESESDFEAPKSKERPSDHPVDIRATMKTQLAGIDAETTGLESGFVDLDEILLNLQPGCLYLIAGATGMGKSSFCLDVAYHVGTKAQLPVAIFSPETSGTAVVEWITCSQSSINHRDLRRGLLQDSDWHRYTNTIAKLMSARIFISPAQTIFVSEIRDECLKLRDEHDSVGLIVVDSLQLLKDVTECRAQEMLSAVCALKHLARELNTVVLLTSQISPWHLKRNDKTPQLIDLLQWGGIEANADAVLFIYRSELYESRSFPKEGKPLEVHPEPPANIFVAKNRNGQTGTICLGYQPEYRRFTNLARDNYSNDNFD